MMILHSININRGESMSKLIKSMCCGFLFLIVLSVLITLTSCESEKNSYQLEFKELSTFPQQQSAFVKQSDINVNNIPESALADSDIQEYNYQKYIWNLEIALVKYNIEHTEYETISSYIQGLNYGNHPIAGDFLDGELVAYHGASYTYYGDTYYKYYNFGDFIYMCVIYEKTNAEKFFTENYLKNNELALQKTKDMQGDDFEYYDPSLTIYEKYEYILKNDMLYLLNHENKKMEEQNKENAVGFEKLEFIKDQIIDSYKWDAHKNISNN